MTDPCLKVPVQISLLVLHWFYDSFLLGRYF